MTGIAVARAALRALWLVGPQHAPSYAATGRLIRMNGRRGPALGSR
jgi:hypothetical protein